MKYILLIIFVTASAYNSIACFCIAQSSFCNHIQSSYFANNGIVCLAETTGNYVTNNSYYSFEMKVVDLLYGAIHPGDNFFANTDTTFWIVLGSESICYQTIWLGNSGDQFIMAPFLGTHNYFTNQTVQAYSLSSCSNDVFPMTDNQVVGAIINDVDFSNNQVWHPDTIQVNEIVPVLNECISAISCVAALNLYGIQNADATYQAGETIESTATILADINYQAPERIALNQNFKVIQGHNFTAYTEACN